jgi:dephospho-CoA kinase
VTKFVVGVTGGIGSGKTTICNIFAARHGVPVIDADVVAREVVMPGQPGLPEIVNAFGKEVLDVDGNLDRSKLRQIVFDDDAQRLRLENILHPLIRDRMQAYIAAAEGPYCLVAIPLLAEQGRRDFLDRILVVDCPTELQMERVKKRDQLTHEQVIAIMRSQVTREERRRLADDIIVNDGNSPIALTESVDKLHQIYLDLSGSPS